jgi:protein gp37
MAMGSKIEWTDATWSPTTGCDKVSPGCDNCYALTMAKRLKSMGQTKYQTDGDPRTSGPGFGLAVHHDALSLPLRWHKPRRIFVNSMSDLFHDKVPDGFIAHVWSVMARCPQHTFQILTKRHARMRSWVRRWSDRTADVEVATAGGELPPMPRGPQAVRETYPSGRGQLFADMLGSMGAPPPGAAYPLYDWAEGQLWWPAVLPNVWLGVSVENQRWADIRIPALLDTPAAVRWVSAEPLLGPLDMDRWLHDPRCPWMAKSTCTCAPTGRRLDWVVSGGESGPRWRWADPDWFRLIRDQCRNAPTAYLHKQNGGCTSKAGGRVLDGKTWDQYPGGAS